MKTSKSKETAKPPEQEEKVTAPVEKPAAAQPISPSVELPHSIAVRQLSEILNVTPVNIIKQLMRRGIMANINQILDYDMASTIAKDFGIDTHPRAREAQKLATDMVEIKKHQTEPTSGLKLRPPVVTIMGHVDHGKTKLLDAIRQSNVVATEAGGITQHIGAYQVKINGQTITFLDTPGHEAFTAMRARGAQVTDITVLVVAADDGVMPQTLEAIDHAKAAGVPIIVAVNKIDKSNANPEKVKQQLTEAGLVVEEWGGDIIAVPVSAKEKKGIPELLENILLVAEIGELRADPTKAAVGVVIEANMDKTKGPLATVLIHNGTLRLGDIVVIGTTWGKIKAMYNDQGKQIRKAEPSMPAEILGLSEVPQVGDVLNVAHSEHQARERVKKLLEAEAQKKARTVSLDNLFDQISSGKVKELNLILKTDVQGSLEPIRNSLVKLSTDETKVRIIHSATGNITESDVMLAAASQGLIFGFSTRIEQNARRLADREGVDIRVYNIIYEILDDVSKALKGMLEPKFVEVIDGQAEVKAAFSSGKKEKVAGILVKNGRITRNVSVRVIRNGKVLHSSSVSSLRRFKDDVKEVTTGMEGGVGVEGFGEFQPGDILEFFHNEKSRG
ncbi:MAG: translation initiation factor IF-2 [Dehalococcoidales bacterium]|nr:translation initiation factor IF-2 [Dehalococcoidales bacterium]